VTNGKVLLSARCFECRVSVTLLSELQNEENRLRETLMLNYKTLGM